jgi:hypothetical protein
MLHRPAWSRSDPGIGPDDRSMLVFQYFVAAIALVVALVLAFSH